MTKTDDRQIITTNEAFSLLAAGSTLFILVRGEVPYDTFDAVFKACTPKPVKVGVYNASEESMRIFDRADALLRVGPNLEAAPPLVTVVTSKRQIYFGEQVHTSKDWQMKVLLDELYKSLMPFDGQSIDSSVTQATPERRDIMNWLITGGDWPPAAMKFARLRTYPHVRNVTSLLAGLLTGLSLLRPGFGVLEGVALIAMIAAIFLHFNLSTLRHTFGYHHV